MKKLTVLLAVVTLASLGAYAFWPDEAASTIKPTQTKRPLEAKERTDPEWLDQEELEQHRRKIMAVDHFTEQEKQINIGVHKVKQMWRENPNLTVAQRTLAKREYGRQMMRIRIQVNPNLTVEEKQRKSSELDQEFLQDAATGAIPEVWVPPELKQTIETYEANKFK